MRTASKLKWFESKSEGNYHTVVLSWNKSKVHSASSSGTQSIALYEIIEVSESKTIVFMVEENITSQL